VDRVERTKKRAAVGDAFWEYRISFWSGIRNEDRKSFFGKRGLFPRLQGKGRVGPNERKGKTGEKLKGGFWGG